MTCFDNSVFSCHSNSSPARTYQSYICESRDSYRNRKNKYNIESRHYNGKLPNISQIRHVLSETISNITKGNKLQKGDSVELTLEIELMKSGCNSPSHSLVEVKIIQHNQNKNQNQMFKNMTIGPVQYQLETISSTSESASQKRRNWFHRVISRQCDYKERTNTKIKQIAQYPTKIDKNPKKDSNGDGMINKNKQNFVHVLPEEITIHGKYTKGYRKVSPNKYFQSLAINQSSKNTEIISSQKHSIVRKLSDIFLPSKKSDKNKAVETALTALKNEVDNMKLVTDRNAISKKKTGTTVHNLGKLVSNILVDVMENSDNKFMNQKGDDFTCIPYQSFFEPISKDNKINKKNIKKKKQFKKISSKQVFLSHSHSDTCCVRGIQSVSDPKLIKSNSINNCKGKYDVGKTNVLCMGDSSELFFSNKNNIITNRENNSEPEIHVSGDYNADNKRIGEKKELIPSNKSVIEWNGQKLQIKRQIKERIEMLIVNELQNLALKEGMECNITPLPSIEYQENPIKNIEKVSSFICELDIGDNTIENKLKIRKPENKPQLPKKKQKKRSSLFKHKEEMKAVLNTSSNTLHDESLQKVSEVHNKRQKRLKKKTKEQINKNSFRKDNITILPQVNEIEKNDVEVTYLNANIKNWSAESNTISMDHTGIIKARQNIINEESNNDVENESELKTHHYEVPSGFVKIIKSDDSIWNKDHKEKQTLTISGTGTVMKLLSSTSNECESSIEIELDLKDLESILKEAKRNKLKDKILISASCKNDKKSEKPENQIRKNNQSYTDQLLTSAARKLENYKRGRRLKT